MYFRDGGNDTNLFIKLDQSEMVLAEEFNHEPTRQEPTVNQPMKEVHHEPVQDNQRPQRKKKLPDWLRDYVI